MGGSWHGTCFMHSPKLTTLPLPKEISKNCLKNVDDERVFHHSLSMQNNVEIIKVNKFSSVALVTVKYRKADGTVDFASGKTEAEAMANIGKVVEVKSYDFAPLAKRSSSGRYFVNNNGVMVEE